ncbi:hypothetical protein KOR42_40450 [Thalassoglobus neptunius]|uniref:Uncharacterized protein n=1 Tax=Thalassoglobus neptunius TaxID=1938619 RepID=A0A5C5WD14_9PLAN|nr:hypothetical protein [Thalassoglobus neptunius]TWT47961.1 hypothetical protein KOR42_40450 [Thalassoglobus neptunius]
MNYDDALRRIESIETALSRTTWFRGYRSRLVLFSAISGLLGALGQPFVISSDQSPAGFVYFWVTIAILNLALAGVVLFCRNRTVSSGCDRKLVKSAMLAMLPCLFAGAGVTFAILKAAEDQIWMLPGLWAICFGLGVCASQFVLPEWTQLGGVYFLISGSVVLSWGSRPLDGTEIVATFVVGQTLNAFILYWTLERPSPSAGAAHD